MRRLKWQAAGLLAAQAAAFWPVWRWYAARMATSPDDRVGLLAMAVLVVFLWRKSTLVGKPFRVALPAVLTLLYAATYGFLPPLGRAAIAMTAMAAMISALLLATPLHLGVWGLFGLALPVIPSLQFYLGYPLRLLVATLTVPILRGSGQAVVRDGVCLTDGGQLILIDAPCSGVKMIWMGLFLAMSLALLLNFRPPRTVLLALVSTALTIIGNVLRASALFFAETGFYPGWIHEATGLLCFAAVAAGIVFAAYRLGKGTACARPSPSV